MANPLPYPFLRPLVDINQNWAALEQILPVGLDATLALVAENNAQANPCPLPWLVPADAAILAQSDLHHRLPPEKIIFILPADLLLDPAQAERLQQLRQQGFRLGAEATDGPSLEALASAGAKTLLVDARVARGGISPVTLNRVRDNGVQLVARSLLNHDLFVWCAARGFSLLSSEFVTQPEDYLPTEADPTKLRLLRLLSLIVQDADTREIEDLFKQEPKLSYNLLRLVNSVSVGAPTKITSFAQAITLLGRRQLQRWLQLLIYANQFSQGSQPNPLMPQAALRGRLVELVTAMAQAAAGKTPDPDFHDCAYMTGAFSLLHVLLHMPMEAVLASLPLSEEVVAALTAHSGLLGDALTLVEQTERSTPADMAAASAILARLGVSPGAFGQAQVQAIAWASQINLE
ncbi:MAG: HDOD domain-containing protein [Betaproteobacteria bacterium]|nr:HDOD domain-containing protein [Betaproteobacteria bacterium]